MSDNLVLMEENDENARQEHEQWLDMMEFEKDFQREEQFVKQYEETK